MRAIRVHQFGGPEVLKLEHDVPVPSVGTGEVLVNVKCVGVNPVDTYICSGTYARKPSLPYTPGSDCAGVVKQVGPAVTSLKEGDRVYVTRSLTGSCAEYATVSEPNAHPLPDCLSFAQGAAVPVPYLTAYRALFQVAGARPGEVVLVHGASGGVGIAATQLARAHGMTVLGTAGTADGMEVVKRAGAHQAYNHRQAGYLNEIKSAISKHGAGGIDVLLENAAHVNLGLDLPLLARGGRLALVGSRGPIQVNPRDLMTTEGSIRGVMLFNATEKELAEAYAAVGAGMESGWLRPIVGAEYPLEKVADAYRDIVGGTGALGKLVINV